MIAATTIVFADIQGFIRFFEQIALGEAINGPYGDTNAYTRVYRALFKNEWCGTRTDKRITNFGKVTNIIKWCDYYEFVTPEPGGNSIRRRICAYPICQTA